MSNFRGVGAVFLILLVRFSGTWKARFSTPCQCTVHVSAVAENSADGVYL